MILFSKNISWYRLVLYAIGVLLLSTLGEVHAQKRVPCNRSLVAAYKEYETGNFTFAVKMLTGCLNNYSKQEKIEANRLLALCYLGLNNEAKAIEASQALLHLKTNYREFPYFDPLEFTKLLARFDIWPTIEVGLKLGLGVNSVSFGKNYSVTGSPQLYAVNMGYQAGIVGEYFLSKTFSMNVELLLEGIGYSVESNPIGNWTQQYVEDLTYFTVPISGKYYFFKHKDLMLAAELGIQTQFLLSSISNFTIENQKTGFTNQSSAELTANRKSMVFYGLAGITLKHKLGMGMFTANVRYAAGLNTIIKQENRYEDINFVMTNQYVDSDIRFNPFYFTFGYQFPIEGKYRVIMRK